MGFSVQGPLLLQSMGSTIRELQQLQHVGSAVAASRLQRTGSTVAVHRLCAPVGSSRIRDRTVSPALTRGLCTIELPRKPQAVSERPHNSLVRAGGHWPWFKVLREARKEHGLSWSNFKGLMVEDSTCSSHCPAGRPAMMEVLSAGTF